MDHNIESSGVSSTLFPFSYGYLIRGYDRGLSNEYNGYGTIMSYSDLPTGRFSDRSERFTIPETGASERLGKDRNGFDVYGIETNPATDGVDHLNRVRYYMSQLHEMFDTSSPTPTPAPTRPYPETDTCGDTPENVFCGKSFSPNALATYQDERFPITTPAGKIHSSRFTTTGSIGTYGTMRWHSPSYADQSLARAWISKVAGGDPVGEYCSDTGSSIMDVVYEYEEKIGRAHV